MSSEFYLYILELFNITKERIVYSKVINSKTGKKNDFRNDSSFHDISNAILYFEKSVTTSVRQTVRQSRIEDLFEKKNLSYPMNPFSRLTVFFNVYSIIKHINLF